MINDSSYRALSEEMIDAILADSFPASDPPPWTTGRENQPYAGCADNSPRPMRIQGLTLEAKTQK
jgi:hypothetical protein